MITLKGQNTDNPIKIIVDGFKLERNIEFKDSEAIKGVLIIWVDKKSQPIEHEIKLLQNKRQLIDFKVPDDIDRFQIVINFPGFEQYVKNIYLEVEELEEISLGKIELDELDTPKIENVTYAEKDPISGRFKLTLNNPTVKDVLVKKISISAKNRFAEKINCHKPDREVIKIQDSLRLGNHSVKGSSILNDYTYNITGSYTLDACSGLDDLSLSIPIDDFVITSGKYESLEIIIPQKLSISREITSTELPTNKLDFKDASLSIKEFGFIVFKLYFDDGSTRGVYIFEKR